MESTHHPRALDWLAEAAPDPDACRQVWEQSGFGVVLLPAGRRWDVLLVAGELGRVALSLLARRSAGGPVLAGLGDEHVGFLVPVGTAARWIGTGVRVAGAGTWVAVPHPAGAPGASAG